MEQKTKISAEHDSWKALREGTAELIHQYWSNLILHVEGILEKGIGVSEAWKALIEKWKLIARQNYEDVSETDKTEFRSLADKIVDKMEKLGYIRCGYC